MPVSKTSGQRVALLRGINVGGKNKLRMADLVAIFEKVGCRDVRTYIQSGNVAYRAPAALVKRVPGLVESAITRRFGYKIPVVTRSARELGRVVQRNPFLSARVDTKALHVAFLASKPGAAGIRSLDPDRSPPDRFEVFGSEIYFYFPNGVARSKLTHAYFDSRLATVSTARNWATVLKLTAMVESA